MKKVESHQKWLELVTSGTDPQSATKQAFNVKTLDSIRTKTSQLKRRYADEIYQAVSSELKYLAPSVLNIIKDIALTGQQESVKLKACQDILSRAGYDATQTIEVKDSTPEQVQAKIQALLHDDPEALTRLVSLIDNPTIN